MPFIIGGRTVGQSGTRAFVLNGDGGAGLRFLTGATALVPELSTATVPVTGLLGVLVVYRRRRAA